jgi:glycosyltransferase involved in cell wall biosynthesis
MNINEKPSRKLTVAHFMPWSGVGGVEVATLRMTDATHDQFRHVAFCLHDAVALRNAFEKSGIETITYLPPEPSLRHGIRYYKASRTIARQIREAGVDVVHFSEEKAAYHNSFAALLSRSRIVCHLRSRSPQTSLRQRLSLWPVESFIFVSKELRQSFALKVPDSKARVIYDAVEVSTVDMTTSNAEVRRELGIAADSTLVGMVARVAPVKDYYTLTAAAAEVLKAYPHTRFLIVGDNSQIDLNRRHYEEITEILNKLGIAESFIFTGHRDDVPRLISAMDISVLCSHREGFPLSILESMAMRKPVVATAVGGIPEIVEPGVTGYLHEPGNSKDLAAAIIRLIESPEEARLMGLTGYERVRLNYSRQKFASEIAGTYSDLRPR